MPGAESCVLCGRAGVVAYSGLEDLARGTPGKWDMLRCGACGLYWMPEQADLRDIYPEDYYPELPVPAGWREKVKGAIRSREAGLAAGRLRGLAGLLLGCVPPLRSAALLDVLRLDLAVRGRVLDLGCGRGEVLSRLAGLGWDALGIEPNRRAAGIASAKGLKVINARFEDVELAPDSFDAVILNHVLEHLADPVGALRACRGWLRKGGRLAVLTPNPGSLGHKLFAGSWQPLDPPRHYFLFSSGALSLAAEKAGFSVRSVTVHSGDAAVVFRNSAALCLRREQERVPGLRLAANCFMAVSRGLSGLGLGEELLLSAEKR